LLKIFIYEFKKCIAFFKTLYYNIITKKQNIVILAAIKARLQPHFWHKVLEVRLFILSKKNKKQRRGLILTFLTLKKL